MVNFINLIGLLTIGYITIIIVNIKQRKEIIMDQETCVKIADEISDKLISLCNDKKAKTKTILELYNELLEKKYHEYRYDILTYIPERLAVKGYEIVNSRSFELKKY